MVLGPRTIQDLLDEVGALHRRYKLGALAPDELDRYRAAQRECTQVVTEAQNRAIPPPHRPRPLRVRRSVPVRIEFANRVESAVTLDVSGGGFGALMVRPPAAGEEATVGIRLPGAVDRVRCKARVVGVQRRGTAGRASFQLLDVDGPQSERLEVFLMDAVLDQLRILRGTSTPPFGTQR